MPTNIISATSEVQCSLKHNSTVSSSSLKTYQRKTKNHHSHYLSHRPRKCSWSRFFKIFFKPRIKFSYSEIQEYRLQGHFFGQWLIYQKEDALSPSFSVATPCNHVRPPGHCEHNHTSVIQTLEFRAPSAADCHRPSWWVEVVYCREINRFLHMQVPG